MRSISKRHFYHVGTISTEPTELGKKELDPFHPSYRVKRIKGEPLVNLNENEHFKDLFLDILANEKSGLISVKIKFDEEDLNKFLHNLADKYFASETELFQ